MFFKANTRNADSLSLDKEEKQNLTEVMKDEKMIERYSKHLNKCFFMTNDPFLRYKHQRYLQ